MSDVEIIMKFEYLPNEILIECFGYLNALHIFYSFDQLNYRFNQLIRCIPLHLDFQNIPQKLICDEFWKKMLFDQEIKKQIYSIHLSNKYTCTQSKWFLSIFSLNEFVHLRSLTLTRVNKSYFEKLKTTLPLMAKLSSICMIDCWNETDEILSVLPLSQLRRLMIAQLPKNLKLIDKDSSITNLTISYSESHDLYQVLNSASKLNYLAVKYVSRSYPNLKTRNICSTNNYITNLHKLIITKFKSGVDDLFIILKQTPNLKSLTINAVFRNEWIDACEWEDLIASSLPYLNVFKFYFEWVPMNRTKNEINNKFKQFQSDFWCKQHHWYTEYSLSPEKVSIYTIPYIFDSYILQPNTDRYSNQMMNNIISFDNIKDLTVVPSAITEKCQYHFSYVTSLTFHYSDVVSERNLFLTMQDIKHLKTIVNLSHVKHLDIQVCYNLGIEIASVLTEILKEALELSSLEIHSIVLHELFNDDEFCKCLNRMIKKLYISGYSRLWDTSKQMNRFCEVLSNLEELKCEIRERDVLLFLLQHLSKLTFLSVHLESSSFRDDISWLEEETHKLELGIKIITEFDESLYRNSSIWIIRNIH
jgi:hypothetical protein